MTTEPALNEPTSLTPAQLHDGPTMCRMRDEGPVHRVDLGRGGTEWLLTGYDVAVTGFSDQRLQGDGGVQGSPIEEAEREGRIIFEEDLVDLSGKDHLRVRRMISRQLTPRRVTAMLPRIQRITDELLAAIPADRPVDLIAAFARPLPIMALCALLGIPDEDRAYVHAYVTGRVATQPDQPRAVSPGPDMTTSETVDMVAYVTSLIAERRREPGDDLVSSMIRQAGKDGLPDAYVVAGVRLTLVAGHRAVTSLVANGMALLLGPSGMWRRLVDEPALVDRAVEELLRYVTPIALSVPRHTTAEVEFGTSALPENAVVRCAWSAANRDPARFDRPEVFDPAREDNGHLAFGHGHHFCLGAALARAETRLALATLAERFPAMRLASSNLRYRVGDLREPRELQVILRPV
ncbi:cytochrome P450 [Nonomuraea rhizosphaerae]|uniref:cytochrome P450 n=1 Tax=Nonomuraea rhizosphaerae TaxID=2665663 RepID=UPI001C5FC6C5|nr:cytochrome P450 [Nonomuraea rhizosphaerae]